MRTKLFIAAIIFISQVVTMNAYGQHTSVKVESKKGFNPTVLTI